MPAAQTFSKAFAASPAPFRGAAWMLVAAAAFAAMATLVRVMGNPVNAGMGNAPGPGMHPFEIAFFRNFFGLLFMAPWLMRTGWSGLRTRRIGAYSVRALCGLSAMLLLFWAFTAMPLGEAVALSFTAPLFASIAAILFLGERMGLRRTLALLTGFAGALIILRPGLVALSGPAALVILSSVFVAFSITMVKKLSETESPSAIVTWMGLYLVPLSLIPAAFVWRWPTLEETALLVAMGGFATLGQVAMTRAYAATEATIVLPFDYARLPFAAAIAYLAFAEMPDLWTWIGAAVIATATVYIAHRESMLARRAARRRKEGRIGTITLSPGGAAIEPPIAAPAEPERRP